MRDFGFAGTEGGKISCTWRQGRGPHDFRGARQLRREAIRFVREPVECQRVARPEMRTVRGQLLAQPRNRAGCFDRPRRRPLLNQLEYRRRPCLPGALVPGTPHGPRRENGEQDEHDESRVEYAGAAARTRR